MLRVGRYENIFILLLMEVKITGSVQEIRVGRDSGNTAIFYLRLMQTSNAADAHMYSFQN